METRKKGISLIVLIITIIVMIILAAAIILSISNSGIMDKANKAKEDSDIANLKEYVNVLEAEWELGVAEASGKTKTEYINTKLAEKGYNRKITENGVLLTESATKAIDAGIEIGNVVKYDVTSKTEKSLSTNTGFDDQDVSNQTGLTWRYIGISDNGEIMIAPDVTSDAKQMYFNGFTEYSKGIDELNRLCDVLYSTNKGAARSMTIEDVNKLLGYTEEKSAYIDASSSYTETTNTKTIADLEKELGITLSNRSTPDGKDVGTYKPDYYRIDKENDVAKMKYPENRVYVFFDNTYFLASRCVKVTFSLKYVAFVLRCVGTSFVDSGATLDHFALRPVVSLNSNVQITKVSDGSWELN